MNYKLIQAAFMLLVMINLMNCKKSNSSTTTTSPLKLCRLDSEWITVYDDKGKLLDETHYWCTYDGSGNLQEFLEDHSGQYNDVTVTYTAGKPTRVGYSQSYSDLEYTGNQVSRYRKYIGGTLSEIFDFTYTDGKMTGVTNRYADNSITQLITITWDGDKITKVVATDSTKTKNYGTLQNIQYSGKQNPEYSLQIMFFDLASMDAFSILDYWCKYDLATCSYIQNGTTQTVNGANSTYNGDQVVYQESTDQWKEVTKTHFYYTCP